MTEITYESFEDLARLFPDDAAGFAEDALTELHAAVQESLAQELAAATPVRSGTMKHDWKHLDRNGMPVQTAAAATRHLEPGDETAIVNTARQAIVIERGRKPLRTGRMGGSTEAPRGVVKPTVDRLEKELDGIAEVSLRKAASRARRGKGRSR